MKLRGYLFAGLLVSLVMIVAGAHIVREFNLKRKLIRRDPDSVVGDASLRLFALEKAAPSYIAHCASCHGNSMHGDQARGVPDLTRGAWLYGNGRVAEIERTILYGIRSGDPQTRNYADMPAFGTSTPYRRYAIEPLQPADIHDVIEYIMKIRGDSADDAAASLGKKIFDSNGDCYDCHSPDGRGDNAIGAPDLTDKIWLYGTGTREDLYLAISHGLSGFCPAWRRTLDLATIRALAVFIYVASHSSGAG